MFTQARLKLTLLYVTTILLISSTISLWFYQGASQIVQHHFDRLEQRLDRPDFPPPPTPLGRRAWISPEDLIEARNQLALRLITINTALAFVTAILGYLLAGHTLKPIQKAMQHEKDFITNASHELRTPITALKTALEVNLSDPQLPLSCKSILQDQLTDVNSLHHLADRLLQLSHNHYHSQFQTTDLTPIIKQAIKTLSPLARQQHLKLNSNLPSHLPLTADPQALQELLIIFIDNALKYTPQGEISIVATATKSHITLKISDTGSGIDPIHQSRIWDRFYRIDPSHGNPGHGLGLSVAKTILDQHHATVTLHSQVGQGSTFTIILPRQQPKSQSIPN